MNSGSIVLQRNPGRDWFERIYGAEGSSESNLNLRMLFDTDLFVGFVSTLTDIRGDSDEPQFAPDAAVQLVSDEPRTTKYSADHEVRYADLLALSGNFTLEPDFVDWLYSGVSTDEQREHRGRRFAYFAMQGEAIRNPGGVHELADRLVEALGARSASAAYAVWEFSHMFPEEHQRKAISAAQAADYRDPAGRSFAEVILDSQLRLRHASMKAAFTGLPRARLSAVDNHGEGVDRFADMMRNGLLVSKDLMDRIQDEDVEYPFDLDEEQVLRIAACRVSSAVSMASEQDVSELAAGPTI